MNETIHYINGYKIIEYKPNNIFIILELFDDEFSNKIIKLINRLPLCQANITNTNNVECKIVQITSLLKQDNDFFYVFKREKSLLSVMNKSNNLNGITEDELKLHETIIHDKMKIIKNTMYQLNEKIHLGYNSGYDLRKIHGKTRCHTDGLSDIYTSNVTFVDEPNVDNYRMVRFMSIIFALNDNHDGGIFRFPHHDISFKLKRGSVLLFPPFWTHPHEVSTVHNNTFRYTINTWALQKI
jgi:hypothetical protein